MIEEQAEALQGWIGRSRSIADEFTLPTVRRIAAMLDLDGSGFAAGGELPPHWVGMFFPEIAPRSEIGPDGHPRKGDFLPPVPLPRRMLAGRRLRFHAAPRIGEVAEKRTEIASITPKHGRSGAMIFVTLRHEVIGADGRAIATEEQDVVYREAASASTQKPAETPPPLEAPAAWQEQVVTDPVLVFRYSAVTYNGHRIHYDADYARGEEGYPGIVVNGGLTLLLLLEAARRRHPKPLAGYAARNLKPLIAGAGGVTLCAGAALEGGRIPAWAQDAKGAKVLEATLEFAA
jgi:3-methylfumaryl-CoA hydratase